MNKRFILFCATAGMIAGSYMPMLFGDQSFLSGWSILGGFVGGIVGIWIGVVASKRWG